MAVEFLPDLMPPPRPRLHDEIGTRFSPNSWAQHRLYVTDAPEVLMSGSLGSAKTRGGAEKGDTRCRRFPGSITVVGRRYQSHVRGSTMREFREKVIPPSMWSKYYHASTSTLFYPNGSQMWFVGFDNPDRLLSAEVDMIIVDECRELSEEQWNMAADRARRVVYDDEGNEAATQIIGMTNPDTPAHFLYRRFRPNLGSHIEWTLKPTVLRDGRVLPAGMMQSECICSQPFDNYENLTVRYLAQLERRKGTPYYERMVLGKWVAYEGMVYDCFDEAYHTAARPSSWVRDWGGYPPPTWDRVRAFDFGFNPDPFVAAWFARSPAGIWYNYRTLYRSRVTAPEMARRIADAEERELSTLRVCAEKKNHPQPEHLPYVGSYADHDSGVREILRQEGIITMPAVKDIEAGIQTVYGLLQKQERPDGPPTVRLKILRDALVERDEWREENHLTTDGIEEFYSYMWAKPNDDTAKPNKQVPIDANNHFMDCLRYAFHSLFVKRRWT